MPDFDWSAFVAQSRYFPNAGLPFHPWCYRRPNGDCVTCIGTTYAVLAIDGQHVPGEPQEYGKKLLLKDDRYYSYSPSGESNDRVFAKCDKPMQTVTLATLRALVGEPVAKPAPKEKKCDECNGTGQIECYHCGQDMDCEDCDGEGVIDSDEYKIENRYLRINKYHFNTRYLAPLLAGIPDCPLSLFSNINGGCCYMLIVGDGWRLLTISLVCECLPSEGKEVVV